MLPISRRRQCLWRFMSSTCCVWCRLPKRIRASRRAARVERQRLSTVEKTIMSSYRSVWKTAQGWLAVMFLTTIVGCSTAEKPADTATSAPSAPPSVKKIPPGQQFSGFLKNYEQLKPNEKLGGNALTYAGTEARKNLRSYFAIVVDPIEVYVATDTDASKVDEDARATLTNYFHHALLEAVSDAFPPVDKPGPLTLRLRAALVGVDVGGQVAAADAPADAQPLKQAMNIGKVQV